MNIKESLKIVFKDIERNKVSINRITVKETRRGE